MATFTATSTSTWAVGLPALSRELYLEDVKSEPHCSLSSVLSAASWCVSEFCVTGTVTLSLYHTSQVLPFSHIAGKTPPPPPDRGQGSLAWALGLSPQGLRGCLDL